MVDDLLTRLEAKMPKGGTLHCPQFVNPNGPEAAARIRELEEAVAAEREACAKLADDASWWTYDTSKVSPEIAKGNRQRNMNAKWIASAIRARAALKGTTR